MAPAAVSPAATRPAGRRPALGATLLALLALILVATARPAAAQDTGWSILSFDSQITIEPDAALLITETIDVDFAGLTDRRGIFREIPVRYKLEGRTDRKERVYELDVLSVTNAEGRRWKYEVSNNGGNRQIKIGDADVIVRGRQRYVITYRVRGALNAFPDHDELFWNVNGPDWPVPTLATSATVLLPGGLEDATCFEGYTGSREPCAFESGPDQITYRATGAFQPGQQLTIVAAIRKGAVAEPEMILADRAREPWEYFELTGRWFAGLVLGLVGAAVAGAGALWWRNGRDRRYTSLYYLTENTEEETKPLFARDQIVVEYQPPEQLRPAQIGILQDERADTLDLTATIVDLAVRGYLTITELERSGLKKWFGKQDWQLDKVRDDTEELQPYERIIFDGLFAGRSTVKLSELKNTFYSTLASAKTALVEDATGRGWFTSKPTTAGALWAGLAVAAVVAGVGLIILLGRSFGAGLLGLPLVVLGIALLILSPSMKRRSAKGSEALRRSLGFREYLVTAETDRQRFNEQAKIFAEYLPYAVVFGVVDRWARAFRDIDTTQAVGSWYTSTNGIVAFSAGSFTNNMSSFSSSVSSSIASTPGGSGGSGFGGGGGSGGGGGGGGGGSW